MDPETDRAFQTINNSGGTLEDKLAAVDKLWATDQAKADIRHALLETRPPDVTSLPATSAEPEPPKLTATGQALQSALDFIGRGGERADIQAELDRRVASATQAGDADTANALSALAFNYLISSSEPAAGSTSAGWAYLGNVQRDIAAGKYNVGATAPASSAPSSIDAAQNRLAQAVREGNPREIALAQRALQQAKVEAVKSRTETTTTTTAQVTPGAAAPLSGADRLTATKWPEVVALKQTLQSLDGATITVNTVTAETTNDFLYGRS